MISVASRVFYQYLGVHSFLIGLFPFYVPVFLWKQGFELAAVCIFISLSGLGFCVGLWSWDRIRFVISFSALVGISLLLQMLVLLNMLILDAEITLFVTLGLVYGFYNAFYWTTQRALFFSLIDKTRSGRKYGNLQIFVGALLQLGILLGGFLLERNSLTIIFLVSLLVSLAGFFVIIRNRCAYPTSLTNHNLITISRIIGFKDTFKSRFMFLMDGFFLFAESFFWLLSLFLLVRESFAVLSVLVLSLAIIFFILFFLIKNTIDRMAQRNIYYLAVVLYAFSWLLRGFIDGDWSQEMLFLLLILISFFTILFRLMMNKRFYDLAKQTIAHDYLMLKSYFSQAAIAVVFALMAVFIIAFGYDEKILTPIYWIGAVLSLAYFYYRSPQY